MMARPNPLRRVAASAVADAAVELREPAANVLPAKDSAQTVQAGQVTSGTWVNFCTYDIGVFDTDKFGP